MCLGDVAFALSLALRRSSSSDPRSYCHGGKARLAGRVEITRGSKLFLLAVFSQDVNDQWLSIHHSGYPFGVNV